MDLSKNEAKLLKEAYRLIADYDKYFPETETAISDFENKYGVIPSDYRYLLQEYGGCHFLDPWIFTIKELSESFADLANGYEHDNIVSNDNVFPVGSLGCGSYVCVIKETGKIAILPHDEYVEAIDDLEIIANSFKELVMNLATMRVELERQIRG